MQLDLMHAQDWGPNIDVVGFWFLDLKTNFKPSQELLDFIKAGDKPMYVGFGSIIVDDPKTLGEVRNTNLSPLPSSFIL